MAQYKVEVSGINTGSLPLLSNDEKETLIRRIKQGDKEARTRYIQGNLRLVLSIIKRFQNSNENMDDLFQIGCIGLMKAIDNFDLSQNVKFSTYAVPMIMGELRRYLRDNNTIRVSRSLRDLAYKAIYAKEAIMKQQGNRTHTRRTGQPRRSFAGGTGLCSGRHPKSGFPVRTRLLRRRRHLIHYGPDQ